MKDDELQFLISIYKAEQIVKGKEYNPFTCRYENIIGKPRDIINSDDFSMYHKRAWYILEKWCHKGWYEFGVTLDLGWLTDKGKEIAFMNII